jgi:uncharacterized surface protein with fasciclin (FAS1) repeats
MRFGYSTLAPVAALTIMFSPMTVSDAQAQNQNIVETARAAGNFQTLVTAIEAAELGDTLSGDGPFTVFAPTDAAFQALPPGTLDELLRPENRERLRSVLTYHVVAEELRADDLLGEETTVETVEGSELTVDATGAMVMVNEANVNQPDIEASNGVIHSIDAVLLPD